MAGRGAYKQPREEAILILNSSSASLLERQGVNVGSQDSLSAYQPVNGNNMSSSISGRTKVDLAMNKTGHHAHTTQELSRIVKDPKTGRCYCRGKVLGKVKDVAICIRPSYVFWQQSDVALD